MRDQHPRDGTVEAGVVKAWIGPAQKQPQTSHHRGMRMFAVDGETIRLSFKIKRLAFTMLSSSALIGAVILFLNRSCSCQCYTSARFDIPDNENNLTRSSTLLTAHIQANNSSETMNGYRQAQIHLLALNRAVSPSMVLLSILQ